MQPSTQGFDVELPAELARQSRQDVVKNISQAVRNVVF